MSSSSCEPNILVGQALATHSLFTTAQTKSSTKYLHLKPLSKDSGLNKANYFVSPGHRRMSRGQLSQVINGRVTTMSACALRTLSAVALLLHAATPTQASHNYRNELVMDIIGRRPSFIQENPPAPSPGKCIMANCKPGECFTA